MEAHFGQPLKQHPGQQQVDRGAKHWRCPPLSYREAALYNWKYVFLQPTLKEVIKRYNDKFRPTIAARHAVATAIAAAKSIAKGTSSDAGPSDVRTCQLSDSLAEGR